MKYLGIDYGAKRIGIAVSNDEGTIAFPRATVENDARLFPKLESIIADEKIASIVVGDTRSHSHLENPVTKEAESFIERLKKRASLPIEGVWEAGSSAEASRYAPESAGHSPDTNIASNFAGHKKLRKKGRANGIMQKNNPARGKIKARRKLVYGHSDSAAAAIILQRYIDMQPKK